MNCTPAASATCSPRHDPPMNALDDPKLIPLAMTSANEPISTKSFNPSIKRVFRNIECSTSLES